VLLIHDRETELSEETAFWLFLICILLGAILIIIWLVPSVKIAAVGIIPFVAGIVALIGLQRKRKL